MRKKERVLINLEVIINGILKATALDISDKGMYIATQAEFLPKSKIELSFKIKDKDFKTQAIIKHCQQGIGIGVEFLSPSPDLIFAIKELFRSEDTFQILKKEQKMVKNTVLLVDDSQQARAIYKNKLQSEGFCVIEGKDGIEAFKLLQEHKPDLLILDLWMGGLDGFKLLQLMKLNPELQKIPVIILSARAIPSDVEKALSLGAKEFLPKATTSPVKLLEKIRQYLS